jgi:hypothetical protein
MKIRNFDLDDYLEVEKWWKSWGWSPIPPTFLSSTGFVVESDKLICAGWLYKTDSAVCWAENYIANKEVGKKERAEGLDMLIETLIQEGKKEGFKVMMSSTRCPFLIKKLLKAGCEKIYDTGMSNLVRVL